MRASISPAVLAAVLLVGGCSSTDHTGVAAADPTGTGSASMHRRLAVSDFVEILPGVRVNEELRTLEFDAEVAIDCHHPETPDVYLEVICCTPDTREHESLVVTTVAPSSIHAALLALGGEPGRPGGWRREGDTVLPVVPEGDRVRVWFITRDADGVLTLDTPAGWIVHRETRRPLTSTGLESGWVFAGSRMREYRGREVYDADGTGQLIGLHTFGSETIAWTRVESPEASVQEPLWLADRDVVPAIGTPVTVRVSIEPAASISD
ncbi:MAG: YdjY domain-containing protein [Phycisphaerales bacterium JB041]